MLKTFVWIAGEHAALLRAKSHDEAYGMVLAEIVHSGRYLRLKNGFLRTPDGVLPCNPDGTISNEIVKEAVDLFSDEDHKLQEITENDVSRRPLDVSRYAHTL